MLTYSCSFDSAELAVEQSPASLCDVVRMLSQNVQPEVVEIPLRRGHVLEDALRSVRRSCFSANNTLNVSAAMPDLHSVT